MFRRMLGLSFISAKIELCFLREPTEAQRNAIVDQFANLCSRIKATAKDDLVIMGASVGKTKKHSLLSRKETNIRKTSQKFVMN